MKKFLAGTASRGRGLMRNIILSLCAATLTSGTGAACGHNPTRPDSRYVVVDGSDGAEVLDTVSNLIWQRCVVGKTWDAASKQCTGKARNVGWQVAMTLGADAPKPASAGSAWHLPSYMDLLSLLDLACRNPAVNAKWFADPDILFLWSGTSYEKLADYAWGLKYATGDITYDGKNEEFQVRLVRSSR